MGEWVGDEFWVEEKKGGRGEGMGKGEKNSRVDGAFNY